MRNMRPVGRRGSDASVRCFLVFDARLRLWGESAGATLWLKQVGGPTELVSAIRRFRPTGQTTATVALDFGEARITRIGARRSIRFLVELTLRTARTAGEKLLSKTQIQVARQAADGATLREIARTMDRSPDTVRSHLREVYRRLEVSSRLELARALARPGGSP